MKRTFKFRLLTTVLLIAFAVVFGACGKDSGNSNNASPSTEAANDAEATATNAAEPEKTAELVWYYPGPPQADLQSVEDAVNAYIKEKINATVKLKPVDFGGYDQKMNTVLAASEQFDIAWSSGGWLLQYVPNVRKGAFLAIDDLLAKFPELQQSMPQVMWDNVKVDGKTYAIPNYQTITQREGFIIQKRFIDKYHLDVNSIKSYKDLEPFLESIKQNEPGIIPFGGTPHFSAYQAGYWRGEGLIKKDDSEFKMVVESETPEFKQHLELVRDWYLKGYIPKDSATAKWDEINSKGTVAVQFNNVLKPGGEVETTKRNGNQEVVYVPITDPYISSDTNGTLNAISRTSKNPEKALALLSLVNTDPYLYNLLCFGIEGKHYNLVDGTHVSTIKDGGYDPNTDWVFGNQFNAYFRDGQDPKTWEITKEWNNSAIVSPLLGFSWDFSAVKTEKANVDAVMKEYSPGLLTGTLDPAEYLAKYNEKLNSAGIHKIVESAQTALDAWLQENGKK